MAHHAQGNRRSPSPGTSFAKANDRLLNALASVDDSRSLEELTAGIQKHTQWNGRRVRDLRPWAEDKELFATVNHGEFLINGFRNRDLRKLLYETEPESQSDRRRRSSAISRKLRLLRAHGIIRKVPHTHSYQVTDAGRAVLVAVLTAARTSVNQLNQRMERTRTFVPPSFGISFCRFARFGGAACFGTNGPREPNA